MKLTEKAAYLKGLMDGLKLDTENDTNRLLTEVVKLLADMTESIDELEENVIAVSDELDEIEENLDAIDEFIMDDEDDDEDDYEDEDYLFDDDGDEKDNPLYEVTCPKCGEVQQLDEDTLLAGSVTCPKCGEPLEFEFDEDDSEEDF